MEEYIFIAVIAAVIVTQLVLCLKAKRTLLKWLPALIIVCIMALCWLVYCFSANWAYLIIIALLFYVLVGDGLGWIMGLTWCWLRDQKKTHL